MTRRSDRQYWPNATLSPMNTPPTDRWHKPTTSLPMDNAPTKRPTEQPADRLPDNSDRMIIFPTDSTMHRPTMLIKRYFHRRIRHRPIKTRSRPRVCGQIMHQMTDLPTDRWIDSTAHLSTVDTTNRPTILTERHCPHRHRPPTDRQYQANRLFADG